MHTCKRLASAVPMLLLAIFLPATLPAQISGPITSDTTWAAGTVSVSGTVTVLSGFTLTIQPGTTVEFAAGTGLIVAGALVADGDNGSPILFTSGEGSPAPGDWNGIEFQNTASLTSVIDYCIIEYAGGGSNAAGIFYRTGAPNIAISYTTVRYSANKGVDTRGSAPVISNSEFYGNTGYAIYSDLFSNFNVNNSTIHNNGGGIRVPVNSTPTISGNVIDTNVVGIFVDNSAIPTIQNNNIRENATGIQFTALGATQPTINNNTISGNSDWGFHNTATSGAAVIVESNYWGHDSGPFHASLNPTGLGDKVSDRVDFQPWSIVAAARPVLQITAGISVPTTWYSDTLYWVKNSITVSSTLTIQPGTIVKFATSARLTINGSILAAGTADSLIVFTSERDDPYGGDTNGDGVATGGAPGNWDMVYLNAGSNTSSVLDYCLFRFGGSSGNGNIRIHSAVPSVTNITSTQSSNYGLYITSGSNIALSNSYFGGNANDGVLIQGSNPSFYNSSFVGNGRYGIYVNSGSSNFFSVRKSTFTGNSHGIVADQGTAGVTLTSLDSSDISNNVNGGVYLVFQTGDQTISYNRVANNGTYGIWCFNTNGLVTFEGDTVENNGQEGIVTSKAAIQNNVISGNRYPIGHMGRVGSTYSGNTITGNAHNNAVALRINFSAASLSDTLRSLTTSGFATSYVVIDNTASMGVENGKTLVIEPGVIIKINTGQLFRVDGTLIADGTPEDPIVFTSYRDASYGGKTNLASDTNPPAPGDWRYVRIRPGAGASNSILDNVIFKFGGSDGVGNLWIEGSSSSMANAVTNVTSRRSSNIGIYVQNVQMIIDGAVIDSNATYGMQIDGSSPRADVTVRNSTVRRNGSAGLRAFDNSTFREISNCIIEYNNASGVAVDNGTVPTIYSGNTVNNNNGYGFWIVSSSIPTHQLSFFGNTVSDNALDGVFSTAATFVDNTITGNRYPIGVFGRLGNRYTDNNGDDGNIITGNTFNNAIAIAGAGSRPLRDTLKSTFPQAITSRTYVAIENLEVATGQTLVIEPGVIVKFEAVPGSGIYRLFNVYGTLLSEGTPAEPIVFTSWRDSTFGGKTLAEGTFGAPAPGDWYYVRFITGGTGSVVRHTQFRYGGRNVDNTVWAQAPVTFSNNLIRRSMASGIAVDNTSMVIDSTTVDSCLQHGIYVYDRTSPNVSVTNSVIMRNGLHGLYAEGNGGRFSLISNNLISYNGNSGIRTVNNTIPLSIVGNSVINNTHHGIYAVARNDAVDSLLIIAGNKIRDNGITGLYSSRALVVDDSITGNRYGVGVVGQLSLDGSTTESGNVYIGTVVEGNTYNDVLVAEEATFGKLGASMPPGATNVVVVRGGLQVPSGTTMIIQPGTVIKFANEYSGGAAGSQGRFRVDGVLKSEGTLNEKIVFTSWRDDSYGGDTNADENATVPGPGNWDMLYLVGANNNDSHILHTIVRYGGYSSNGNIRLDNNNAPIDSSFFSYSTNYGVYLVNSSPSVFANEIHHNHTGVFLSGSSNPIINYNNISDNSTYGLYQNTSNTINALNNYWGHESGPYVTQSPPNLAGQGDRIFIASGGVNYDPWLLTRSGILLGDVSQNGTITAFDGAIVLRAVVELDTLTAAQAIAADVSADGNVTAYDASLILRYVVGLITGFPGLGKSESEGPLASSYDLRLHRGAGDEVELVLSLKGTAKIYATELYLTFDESELTPVGLAGAPLSEGMSLQSNLGTRSVRIALAGTEAVESEGDLIRLVFMTKRPVADLAATSIRIEEFRLNESELSTGWESAAQVPTTFGLDQNFPNPFNPETSIRFQLPTPSLVSVIIYDLLGREVRSLVDGTRDAGFYSVVWDGRNNLGQQASSGVYFYRLHASGGGTEFTTVKRMLLVR